MERGVRINLRGRLTCTVYRRVPHPDCKSPEEAKAVQLRNVVRDPVTGKFTVGGWCQELKKQRQQQHQGTNHKGKMKKFGEVDGDDIEEDEEREEWRNAEDNLQQQQQQQQQQKITQQQQQYAINYRHQQQHQDQHMYRRASGPN